MVTSARSGLGKRKEVLDAVLVGSKKQRSLQGQQESSRADCKKRPSNALAGRMVTDFKPGRGASAKAVRLSACDRCRQRRIRCVHMHAREGASSGREGQAAPRMLSCKSLPSSSLVLQCDKTFAPCVKSVLVSSLSSAYVNSGRSSTRDSVKRVEQDSPDSYTPRLKFSCAQGTLLDMVPLYGQVCLSKYTDIDHKL